jgi:hypothetical protein
MRITRMLAVAIGATAAIALLPSGALAANCIPVNTSKGQLSAAAYDTSVTGTLDATGCDIGAYYDSAGNGSTVSVADISGAQQYGVFVDGGKGDVHVDVTNSSIHNIGDTPPDGVQRGVGVYYYGYGTPGAVSGNVDTNDVYQYQKGGIVVNGSNAAVSVTNNTVAGLGPVNFIAQNGVQFGYGATGVVSGNQISDNNYTGCSNQDAAQTGCVPYVSAGLLLYDVNPSQITRSKNLYRDDQRNELLTTAASVDAHSS